MEKKYESQYLFKTKQMQKAHEGRLTEMKNRQKGILESLERKRRDLEDKAKQINEDEFKMI